VSHVVIAEAAAGAVAVIAVAAPLLGLMAAESVMLLVPAGWRARRRHGRPRPAIPARLRRIIGSADRHRCCYCHSRHEPQVDHIRPWSLGGLSAAWNLAILCGHCNRVKSDYWRHRDGDVHYNPWEGHGDMHLAAMILARELRHRRSPLRWARLAIAACAVR